MPAKDNNYLTRRMRWAARLICLVITVFGGILTIFVATPLLYPHWLFVILGIPGAAILYLSTREEERRLVRQFGSEYEAYMKRVPEMNLILGITRLGR